MTLENPTKSVESPTTKLESKVSEKLHNEVFDRYPQNYQTKDATAKEAATPEKQPENKAVDSLPKFHIVNNTEGNSGGAYAGETHRGNSNRSGDGPSAAGAPASRNEEKPLLKKAQ